MDRMTLLSGYPWPRSHYRYYNHLQNGCLASIIFDDVSFWRVRRLKYSQSQFKNIFGKLLLHGQQFSLVEPAKTLWGSL
jgi:hypothetical protein